MGSCNGNAYETCECGKSQTQMHVCLQLAKGGLDSLAACAPTLPVGAHSNNQARCQTNRWSQQRDVSSRLLRCDCNRCNADTNAWHSVTAHCVYTASSVLTYFERMERELKGMTVCTHDHTQDHVCQQQRRYRYVRERQTGVDFTVQSCCSSQILIIC